MLLRGPSVNESRNGGIAIIGEAKGRYSLAVPCRGNPSAGPKCLGPIGQALVDNRATLAAATLVAHGWVYPAFGDLRQRREQNMRRFFKVRVFFAAFLEPQTESQVRRPTMVAR